MTSQPDPVTRRNVDRVATNFPGRVIIPGRHPLTCQVKDMSENGALLEFRAAIWLPPRFHLSIDAMDTEAYCELRHQRSNRVGVTFVRVTVKKASEPATDANVRRTADHWDTAEEAASALPPVADEPHDTVEALPEAPIAMPAIALHRPARTLAEVTAQNSSLATDARAVGRPGSAIRTNVRAAQNQAKAAAKQTSLIGRLFGR